MRRAHYVFVAMSIFCGDQNNHFSESLATVGRFRLWCILIWCTCTILCQKQKPWPEEVYL